MWIIGTLAKDKSSVGDKLRNNCLQNEHSELTWEGRTKVTYHLVFKIIVSDIIKNYKEGQVSEKVKKWNNNNPKSNHV